MKNKIVITGCAGFIGSHLAERLIKLNYKVVGLDNLSTGRLSNIKTFKNSILASKLWFSVD